MKNSRITLHMVCSLDGYIAKNDGSIDWMLSKDSFAEGVTLTEKDISDFLASVDCYVMGSYTYEHALELGWPYGETPVYVLSSRTLPKEKGDHHLLFRRIGRIRAADPKPV